MSATTKEAAEMKKVVSLRPPRLPAELVMIGTGFDSVKEGRKEMTDHI